MDPVVDVMLEAATDLARRSDAVVGHFMTHTAGAAAELHGRPYVFVSLAPVLPSVHYPPIGTPNLGRLFNPLLWKLLATVLESVMRDCANRTRARVGLPEVKNILASTLDHTILALAAVSPTLFARPVDWDPRIQIPGFLCIPESVEPWEPSPDLRAFLEAGPPPAFLSFGSMLNIPGTRALEAVRALIGAVKLAETRGIIQAPEALAANFKTDDRICFITRAPHSRLFPKCSVIVHHGGAGTTQSATLAGRPSLVAPARGRPILLGRATSRARPWRQAPVQNEAHRGTARSALAENNRRRPHATPRRGRQRAAAGRRWADKRGRAHRAGGDGGFVGQDCIPCPSHRACID